MTLPTKPPHPPAPVPPSPVSSPGRVLRLELVAIGIVRGRVARAMKHAVIAGREAYPAGRMGKKRYADPSSPLGGLI